MHDATVLIAAMAGRNPLETYLAIYLVTIILGNIAAFASFWIIFETNFGIFWFLCLLFTIFLSYVTADLICYFLGRSLRNTRFGAWSKNHLPEYTKAEAMVRKKGVHWLFISKFIVGFAAPVAFSVGWSGMNFKKFYKYSMLSILVWLPVLAIFAYGIVSGLAPLAASNLQKIEWFALAGLILFILLDYAVSHGVRALAKHFLKIDDDNEDLTNQDGADYHSG